MPLIPHLPRPPILDVPETDVEVAYLGALRVLREDPDILAVSLPADLGFGTKVDVRGIDGDPEAMANAPDPARHEVPAVRVTFSIPESRWEDNQSHALRLALLLDLYSPGTNIRDMDRLRALVQYAFHPRDDTRRRTVDAIMAGKPGLVPGEPRANVIQRVMGALAEPKAIGIGSGHALKARLTLHVLLNIMT